MKNQNPNVLPKKFDTDMLEYKTIQEKVVAFEGKSAVQGREAYISMVAFLTIAILANNVAGQVNPISNIIVLVVLPVFFYWYRNGYFQ